MQIRNGSGDAQEFDVEIMAISYAEVVFRLFRGLNQIKGQLKAPDFQDGSAEKLTNSHMRTPDSEQLPRVER
ncbi:hypothetical protein AUC60_11375 [Pseudomonas caspiana]|uniref:Uncharacterized protein n=1 Tax=Pseudomonas caspiana TaxID=1451454 RepID=A0A1Y3P7X4_9PSED|nr:hypothetical protein AUC60_11375 [Pseudomonas caspiana]